MHNRQVWILAAFLFFSQAVVADQAAVAGVWKLVAFDVEDKDTGKREAQFGAKPRGYLVLLPEGRMMAVITAEDRKAPSTEEGRAAAFRSMLAYSGTYRVDGDKWSTKVDVAWNEAWRGTDQVRFFKLDGSRLVVVSAWLPAPNEPQRTIRGILIWEREK